MVERGETVHVLHLNRFFYSSQTSYVISLVQEQRLQGHQAHLIMEGRPSLKILDVYKDVLDQLGAAVITPNDPAALLTLLKDKGFDLIHAHSPLSFSLTANLSTQLNIPYVVTCHGLGLNQPQYHRYLRGAGAIICISYRVAHNLRDFTNKTYIVPIGVDLSEYKPGQKNEPVKIVLLTRVDSGRQKGFDHFCKAADLLDGIEFYVAANTQPNSKHAIYLGGKSQNPNIFAKSDIVAGTGRTVAEGLATGNAVFILGRTYQGILTPEKLEKQKYLDLSGLSGSEPCYRSIFLDLAKLTQNQIYLRHLQRFGRSLAQQQFDHKLLTRHIVEIYEDVLRKWQE
jgi:hypothetical protein